MKKRLLCFLIAMFILAGTMFTACTPASNSGETQSSDTGNAVSAEDPADDGVLRILMVGNSFCYYFTDELYGMLKSAGIEAQVSNVYYPGCSVSQHSDWLYDNSPNYEFITVDEKGRDVKVSFHLKACLEAENWDIITLQQHFEPNTALNENACKESTITIAGSLFTYLKENYPLSELLWHHTWAYQVGYQGPLGSDPANVPNEKKVLDVQTQTTGYENIRAAALAVCEQNSVGRIPSGDAWQIARTNPVIGDTLCNKENTDYYHDGDIGGGQYLNACVWFEVVTGQSCVGNTFRPAGYELSEEKITALQEAAHQAVADMAS